MSFQAKILLGLFLRVVAAALLFQVAGAQAGVYGKSNHLFRLRELSLGGIVIGTAALLAGVMLLIPSKTWVGALFGLGLTSGTVVYKLAIDGLQLRTFADGELNIKFITVGLCCALVLVLYKHHALGLFKRPD